MDEIPDLGREAGGEQEMALSIPPNIFPGQWANAVSVARTPHEFTIDFIRVGPAGTHAQVISRMSFSPLLLSELLPQLQEHWERYSESQPE